MFLSRLPCLLSADRDHIMLRTLTVLFAALTAVSPAPAAAVPASALRVLPGDVVLTGPHASQQLLVVDLAGTEVAADRTSAASASRA